MGNRVKDKKMVLPHVIKASSRYTVFLAESESGFSNLEGKGTIYKLVNNTTGAVEAEQSLLPAILKLLGLAEEALISEEGPVEPGDADFPQGPNSMLN